jgi:RHS repeat-associated protein
MTPSGTDAKNRYYSNAYGRFMTPDPYQGNGGGPGDANNPQSWNRYAYVLGDPTNWVDPTGLDGCPAGMSCTFNIPPNPPPLPSCGNTENPIPCPVPVGPLITVSGPTPNPGGTVKNTDSGHHPCPAGTYPSTAYGPPCLTQQQQCLNSFNNSSLGAAINFLSVINLLQNLGNISTVLDWTLIPAAKAAAITAIQDLSSTVGSTDFYSIAGTSQTASIETELGAALKLLESQAAAPILFAVVPIATAVDAGVQQMCTDVPGLRFNAQ